MKTLKRHVLPGLAAALCVALVASIAIGAASRSSNPQKLLNMRLFGGFFQVDNTTEAARTFKVDVGDTETALTMGTPDDEDGVGITHDADGGHAYLDDVSAWTAGPQAYRWNYDAVAGSGNRLVRVNTTLTGGAKTFTVSAGTTIEWASCTPVSGSLTGANRADGEGTRTYVVTFASGGTESIRCLLEYAGTL